MYILAITKIFLGFAKEWTTKLVQCQQFKQKHKRRPKDLDTQKISKNMFSNILFYHPTIVQRIHVLGSLCQTVWPDWTTLCHWGKYPTLKFMSHRYEKIGISNGIRTWWHITILSEKKNFFSKSQLLTKTLSICCPKFGHVGFCSLQGSNAVEAVSIEKWKKIMAKERVSQHDQCEKVAVRNLT
jgi:hypothetical protein